MTNPIETLAHDIAQCERCPLHQTRHNTVPGSGDPNADIMFIGERPGQQEDQQGKPFIGTSGKRFDQILQATGIDRRRVFITNVLKCRAPENRNPAAGRGRRLSTLAGEPDRGSETAPRGHDGQPQPPSGSNPAPRSATSRGQDHAPQGRLPDPPHVPPRRHPETSHPGGQHPAGLLPDQPLAEHGDAAARDPAGPHPRGLRTRHPPNPAPPHQGPGTNLPRPTPAAPGTHHAGPLHQGSRTRSHRSPRRRIRRLVPPTC